MKKQLLKYLATIILALLIFNCKKNNLSPEIEFYLTSALDSIKNNALMSSKVDWSKVKKEVFKEAVEIKTTEQTYDILESVLSKLKDSHSFLQKNGANISFPNSKEKREPSPYGSRMKIEYGLHQKDGKTFARLFVPQGMRGDKFAQDLQDKIFEMQSSNPSGWIVDLRGNGGGNMWPMLAGIGPLVGENPLGGSQNAKKEKDIFRYEQGKAIYVSIDGKQESWAQAEEKARKIHEETPIALLIDRGTASSGEALSVIFSGRKNTMSFGEQTYGASTSTRGIKLSDSLNLVIAVSTFQDRNGQLYLNGVVPDIEIPIGDEMHLPEEDPVIKRAIDWLYQKCN